MNLDAIVFPSAHKDKTNKQSIVPFTCLPIPWTGYSRIMYASVGVGGGRRGGCLVPEMGIRQSGRTAAHDRAEGEDGMG